ncbi:uncharacterized protein DUF4266 [Neolewinella xylanilytica]|uniref:Uncharacterized protein DUF4266 n=1 Tax=Neolewinella xylanilytica TaxID=1514080 RepID=A0A2S6I4W8_9BACT|nr:DUF4266 domain-containing protein [Neolewinella xylanilytica]PPK86204.1 uncharacterized protein DUF4266 [Neolewinella xylanilytica]
MIKLAVSLICAAFLSSCVAVKGYEMVQLNDPDMALSPTGIEVQQGNFQSYREAASGANGGKTGGGCGCN